jgi:predicted DNA-binding transcriptional regulator YafY
MRGYSYGHYQQLRTFKLCRIQDLSFRGWQFTYPADYVLREDMQNLWDGAQEYEAVIRFQPEVAQLVYEREPAAHIETFPGGWVQVRKTVRNLDEVFYDVLRYGRQAEVIEPPELRERLKLELETWVKNYRN